ncbi:heterodisulfide reductase-related iron-sulfur binding cluster [Thioalkalivibrio sp. HK1]|uniref:heterodisulfide reductase-related iron-sulfur binding cluster n=1 Tax=Thioalkalivibrio sp. HK1 TaxID=1469245 RepID=UPI000472643E|nr:heterodisulfide reductase-related iron-sulfur binding cluster [Thioalkalivibrio sp. HK1]
MTEKSHREGGLAAPIRHSIDWKNPEFHDEDSLFAELERVYDHCHGCRRCVSLCKAFPTLFDLIDESASMELDTVAKEDYWKVVDHCYLCDMCFMHKCPYVPPHEWNIDFPHLMLRAKVVKREKKGMKWRDRVLSSTDALGAVAAKPVVASVVNAVNASKPMRGLLDKVLGVHADAWLPPFASKTLRRRLADRRAGGEPSAAKATPTDETSGKVALFATCYCNNNEPQVGEDLVRVFEHNDIPVTLAARERCCGMPKLENGDIEAVARAKEVNIPILSALVDEGWDIVAPVPSCVLMFKQELPLLFPDDPEIEKVRQAFFDPFEYLMLRHRAGLLDTDFAASLGKVAYHVACHQQVQNIGLKTRDVLSLVPDTEVVPIERCSGHDGTYAVKREFHAMAVEIARPVARRVKSIEADCYTSDCVMAGHHIESVLGDGSKPVAPMTLLRRAYGI